MKCIYCERRAVYEFPHDSLYLCESCGKAFREGFEKGKVYESIRRRLPRDR